VDVVCLWCEDTSGFEPIVDDYKPNAALDLYMKFTLLCLRLVSSKIFQNFITLVIIGASVMVGMQTYPALENEPTLNTADSIVLAIFTVECALKVLAVGLRPWEYLFDQDGINFWNVFDFVVVVVCYLPLDASMVTVIRLFRLLRVLKVATLLPPSLHALALPHLASVNDLPFCRWPLPAIAAGADAARATNSGDGPHWLHPLHLLRRPPPLPGVLPLRHHVPLVLQGERPRKLC
jgi:hypothetical protein